MTRSLTLRREALAALADADLGAVAGGAQWSGDALTCPLVGCTRALTIQRGYECSTFPWC